MADPWPKGPSGAVMTGRKIGIPGGFAGIGSAAGSARARGDPGEVAPVLHVGPLPYTAGRGHPGNIPSATARSTPDITPRSTSRPDHGLAVRAGDDVHEAATLDEGRGVPDAIPPAWSRSSASAMSPPWSSCRESPLPRCPSPGPALAPRPDRDDFLIRPAH